MSVSEFLYRSRTMHSYAARCARYVPKFAAVVRDYLFIVVRLGGLLDTTLGLLGECSRRRAHLAVRTLVGCLIAAGFAFADVAEWPVFFLVACAADVA